MINPNTNNSVTDHTFDNVIVLTVDEETDSVIINHVLTNTAENVIKVLKS